jgi:hypothetical protein
MTKMRAIKKKFLQRTVIDDCHLCIPLIALASGQDSVSTVHRHALNLEGARKSATKVVFLRYIGLRARFFLALKSALNVDLEPHGIDLLRTALFFMFWHSMVRHNMTIVSCFQYRIWNPCNRRRVRDYIQKHEIVILMRWLSRNNDVEAMTNKILFETLCRKNNLPYVGIVATVTDQNVAIENGLYLPKKDLFSKFNGQSGGSGGQAWTYDDVSLTWRNGQHLFNESQLLQYFKDSAHTESVLVQLNLTNGQALQDFSSGALCTIRVVTFKLPGQEPQHLRSSLRMPVGQVDVDNFGAGGLAACIDTSGRLTSAIKKYGDYRVRDVHPDTGAQIAGSVLHGWNDILTLAINAHNALTDICSIGWDIAWTQHGPILVEGNAYWDQAVMQMPNSDPLGKDFCDIYLSAKAASHGDDVHLVA